LTKPIPAKLPCFPCPHGGACCEWGVELSDDEAAAIRARHGDAAVTWSEDEECWRTAVVGPRCVFWAAGCAIHDKPYYPSMCRGFPWRYRDTAEPYPYDATICPEVEED
jgi:hypothetical protein